MDIFVATHRKIDFDLPEGYRPMQVNCKLNGEHWPGYLHDDDGINISEKNESYCELTVQYSLWKNSSAEIKGLCHYRRFLSPSQNVRMGLWREKRCNKQLLKDIVIQSREIESVLNNYDIILPVPNGPFTFTVKDERLQYCYQKDLDILRETIKIDFPDYLEAYDWVLNQKFLSVCNLMIAKKSVFDEYSEWLFDVLSRVEQKCDIESYDSQHKRLYGYLSEQLLGVFVRKKRLKCRYVVRILVADYYDNVISGDNRINKLILRNHLFNRVLKNDQSKLVFLVYRYLKKDQYQEYQMLKQYLADRENETDMISG